MDASRIRRIVNNFQVIECTEGSSKRNWYRWLQLLVGASGFMGFISYGSYIAPFYDLPIILVCYFISLVSLINSLLAAWKLRKRRNAATTADKSSDDMELNLQPNSPEVSENKNNSTSCINHENNSNRDAKHENSNESSSRNNQNNGSSSNCNKNSNRCGSNSNRIGCRNNRRSKHRNKSALKAALPPEEVDHLRKMLRQTLPSPNKHVVAEYQTPPYEQTKQYKTMSPYHPDWINWEIQRLPGESTLCRSESYESSLRFHNSEGKNSNRRSSAQDDACCSSCSDFTYIYSSSSDSTKQSSHGWKTSLTRQEPVGAPEGSSLPSSFHSPENIESLSRTQRPSRLPCDLPEQFPALPFPSRRGDINRKRYRQGTKKFKLRDESTVPNLNKSRSMVDIDQCEHMSRKDVLKVLAHFSPELIISVKPKRSRKKHRFSRNINT